VAGLSGHIGAGGFNLDAMVGYDWSQADTARSVPASGSVNSHYDLESLVLDAAATFDLALGRLTLTPGAGITHVAVRRGAASESGSAAFALNVDGDHHAATFVDGSITMSGSTDNAVRPWASVGVRHQLEGDLVFASAALVGSNARFTVPGAPRKDTVITAGAGIEASVASNVSITASYDGEFGAGTGSTATLGLRARF
jgi:fibronectin-binding autotransporter adhesin